MTNLKEICTYSVHSNEIKTHDSESRGQEEAATIE